MRHRNLRWLLPALVLVPLAVACAPLQPRPAPTAQPQTGAAVPQQSSAPANPASTYRERYRPQFHYTPPVNWMNDPNGMVFYDGEYHLFYQYNPFGNTWGHMSWGHAVSRDMVHWEHRPVAIPEQGGEMAFSGSAVVDWNNTSGFGRDGQPPLVAIYTAAREGNQSQALAYSADGGRTWTRYAGNPVLDIGSAEFRDPKVFWHEGTGRWIMVVAMAMDRRISFYGSPDLKQWTHLSDFGPAGAVGGVWECPELFELPVEGGPGGTRWVLQVDLNPGSIAGGSGGQYFVGHFDGTTFTAEGDHEPTPAYVPAGLVFADFGGPDYGGWAATGNAFGQRPARGTLPGQGQVQGYRGEGLVNSFLGGDAAQGTLTSPEFTIESNQINFLIGGGNHPGQLGMSLLVGDREVRTATGRNDETLDWQSWDVRDLRGQRARIQIFDRHTGGWGHINVDHIMFADEPARPVQERALWVDYGRDFYAAQSWSDVPAADGRRLWLAWMSNWDYANQKPTHPWRSAMSIPRSVHLRQFPEGIRLVQRPIAELQQLRGGHRRLDARAVPEGTLSLAGDGVAGKTLELVVELELGTASEAGLKVRTGNGEETIIGVDRMANQIFVDRTRSGNTEFNPAFPSRNVAPFPLEGGRVRLHVFVDWSSVEVFTRDGQTVFTDRIFPSPESDGVALYARGGTARLVSLDVWDLDSVWRSGTTPQRRATRAPAPLPAH
jgi:sucrose-6-phosphate hydrolase SacC (GH32 family)